MAREDKVNILLVDDQPAKLVSYEVMLEDLGETLIKASSAREALECLLKNDIAVILIDVCMPDLDGFELAAMIREHPRYQKIAIIFISAIQFADNDRLRGYRMGAVDYMPVPVVPEILRAKVKVFTELFRKTQQLEQLNRELEQRVADRTAALESFNARLIHSEEQLRLATEAAEIGLWDVDYASNTLFWPPRLKAMFGISPDAPVSMDDFYAGLHPEDREAVTAAFAAACDPAQRARYNVEYRTIGREDGIVRWVAAKGRGIFDDNDRCVRVIGTAIDITERKRAEEHSALLAREVDHRAKNALAVAQSIVRLTRAPTIEAYTRAVEGRIAALSHAHALLSASRWQGASLRSLIMEELAPYATSSERAALEGADLKLDPTTAQSLALVLHELVTNSAKYGALSRDSGRLGLRWLEDKRHVLLTWTEQGGPRVSPPARSGFGLNVIRTCVENQLHGTVSLDWREDGLYCNLDIPVHRDGPIDAADLTLFDGKRTQDCRPGRPHVLVVEDEMLVALMMQESLLGFGFDVIGPYGRLAEAMRAAKMQTPSAAILDVNVGGEPVYELADFLVQEDVPFIFLTGYGRESIHERFAAVPILGKPVNLDQLRSALAGAISPEQRGSGVLRA